MSFDKNEKDCINGIPLIEIQEKPKLFLLYTGLLSEIQKQMPVKREPNNRN
jgi:hypothetical protein